MPDIQTACYVLYQCGLITRQDFKMLDTLFLQSSNGFYRILLQLIRQNNHTCINTIARTQNQTFGRRCVLPVRSRPPPSLSPPGKEFPVAALHTPSRLLPSGGCSCFLPMQYISGLPPPNIFPQSLSGKHGSCL